MSKPYKNEDWLREKYHEEELTLKEMGELAGVSRETVRRYMKQNEIPRRSDGCDHDQKEFADKELLTRLYVQEDLSCYDIANRYDCDRRTIGRWLDRFGIGRNDMHNRAKTDVRIETNERGYELCYERGSRGKAFMLHRLAAVSKYGFEKVCEMHVHHDTGVQWDNRLSNLELVTKSEHASLHHERGDILA